MKNQHWLSWAMFFLVLVESAFCVREHQLRLRAEEKMKLAYLALNDVRGQSLDSQALRRQLDQALREKSELARSHQSLEFDNLNKEKKISKMTRELHELKVQPASVKQA